MVSAGRQVEVEDQTHDKKNKRMVKMSLSELRAELEEALKRLEEALKCLEDARFNLEYYSNKSLFDYWTRVVEDLRELIQEKEDVVSEMTMTKFYGGME